MPDFTRTQSPSDFTFTQGHAVYHIEGSSHAIQLWQYPEKHAMREAPVYMVPATVIAIGQQNRILLAYADSREVWADGADLVYRGYCDGWCWVPAMYNSKGKLTCPRCGGAAVDEPMPDPMVPVWYPARRLEGWYTAMIAYRALRDPHLTYAEHLHEARWAVRRPYRDMLVQFGVAQWTVAVPDEERLAFWALLREPDEFIGYYRQQQLSREQRLAA